MANTYSERECPQGRLKPSEHVIRERPRRTDVRDRQWPRLSKVTLNQRGENCLCLARTRSSEDNDVAPREYWRDCCSLRLAEVRESSVERAMCPRRQPGCHPSSS